MSLSTLVRIGLGVGVVGLGASIWMERRVQNMYKQQVFYRESVRLLHNYPSASHFLGKPIYSGRVKLGDKQLTDIGEFHAKLVIPVTGPVDKGSLYVKASRENRDAVWSIDQLDLELKSSQQKWTFYKREISEAPQQTEDQEIVRPLDYDHRS